MIEKISRLLKEPLLSVTNSTIDKLLSGEPYKYPAKNIRKQLGGEGKGVINIKNTINGVILTLWDIIVITEIPHVNWNEDLPTIVQYINDVWTIHQSDDIYENFFYYPREKQEEVLKDLLRAARIGMDKYHRTLLDLEEKNV